MALTARFEDALVMATRLHAPQVRKGSEVPYIAHLLAVTAIVLEYGGDEDAAIAALLHDAVENCGGPERQREVEEKFGKEVGEIVAGCTDTDQTPKPPWRERKEKYIAHLKSAPASTRLVSASDKLHNAQAILHNLREDGEEVWTRFKGGKAGTLWYYRSLVTAFRERGESVDR
jgi:(p)ppGpp synthase/HD superfamily hydrolase